MTTVLGSAFRKCIKSDTATFHRKEEFASGPVNDRTHTRTLKRSLIVEGCSMFNVCHCCSKLGEIKNMITLQDDVFVSRSLAFLCLILAIPVLTSSGEFNHSFVFIEAILVSTNNRNQQCIILDTGCTSVYHLTDGSSLVAGTKKGGMHYFFSRVQKERDDLGEDPDPVRNNYAKIDANEDGMWSRSELKSRDYETKYPVYSIATASQKGKNSLSGGPEESFLFFGSGDRWISVWKLTYNDFDEYPQDENRATQAPIFDYVQKLGPHTGWVKALVYDDTNEILHSIGCNCIESWNCSRLNGYHLKRDNDDESSLPIFHITKRTIENCPNLGTTLSSDLLCLCLIKSTIGNDEGLCPLLVSGGVDGRIHLWISDPSVKRKQDLSSFDGRTPLHTTLAHNGRVNAIAYSSAMGTIFTVGNDGVLAVFRVSSDDEFESIFKLEIVDVSTKESSSRLTDVSITMEHRETGECSLAVGTSKGEVYFTTAKLKSDGDVTCQLKNDHVTVKEGSMIYSLSCERNKGTKLTPRIWIGHASGLVTLDV